MHSTFNRARRLGGLIRTATVRAIARCDGRRRAAYIGAATSPNIGDRGVFEAIGHQFAPTRLFPLEGSGFDKALRSVNLGGKHYFRGAILGGGTLINPYAQSTVEGMLGLKVPLWSFGTGVGGAGWDLPKEVSLNGWKDSLSQFNRVSVRGPRSRAALIALGVPTVEVVGDPALLLGVNTGHWTGGAGVFFNVISGDSSENWNPQFYAGLEQALKTLHSFGHTINPLAMDPRDIPALNDVSRRLRIPMGSAWLPPTAAALVERLFRADLVVSMRLHGNVCAAAAGAPFVALVYRDKTLDFTDSVGATEASYLIDMQGDGDAVATALIARAELARDARSGVAERVEFLRAKLSALGREISRDLGRQ